MTQSIVAAVVVVLAAFSPSAMVSSEQSHHGRVGAVPVTEAKWVAYRFEPNTIPWAPVIEPRLVKGGGIEAQAVTVRQLIACAYGVGLGEVDGGPYWLDDDRMDLFVTTHGEVSETQVVEIVRDVVEDYFNLLVQRGSVSADHSSAPVVVLAATRP